MLSSLCGCEPTFTRLNSGPADGSSSTCMFFYIKKEKSPNTNLHTCNSISLHNVSHVHSLFWPYYLSSVACSRSEVTKAKRLILALRKGRLSQPSFFSHLSVKIWSNAVSGCHYGHKRENGHCLKQLVSNLSLKTPLDVLEHSHISDNQAHL